MAIQTKEVKLKDGRVVTLRELTGADEMLSLKICAKEISIKEAEIGASIMQQQNVQVVLSVFKVDGEVVHPPQNLQATLEFMAKFKMHDWNNIKKTFNELNGMDDDFLEDQTN